MRLGVPWSIKKEGKVAIKLLMESISQEASLVQYKAKSKHQTAFKTRSYA